MLLFILIVHFMIINYVSDLQQTYAHKSRSLKSDADGTLTKALEATNAYTPDPLVGSEVEAIGETDGSEDKYKLKELYDFVYGDKTAESTLTNMFTDIKPCELSKDQLVECGKDACDEESSDLVFCKNDVDKHFEDNELERTAGVEDEVGGIEPITKNGNPIVFSYKESERDSLDGFESFGSAYMLLKNWI